MTRHLVRQSARTHASNVIRRKPVLPCSNTSSFDIELHSHLRHYKFARLMHSYTRILFAFVKCVPSSYMNAWCVMDQCKMCYICATVAVKLRLICFFLYDFALAQVHFQRPFSYIHFWTPRGEFSLSIPNSSEVSANPSVSVDGASMAVHD